MEIILFIAGLAMTIVGIYQYWSFIVAFFLAIITFISTNPMILLWSIGIYYVIGFLYSLYGWLMFCKKYKQETSQYNYDPPNASEYKLKIMGMITFWPIHGIIDIWNLFLVDIAKAIYNKFGYVYNNITRYVYEKL